MTTSKQPAASPLAERMRRRFRGYLPAVVDVETGGFDPERDALLEIAVVVVEMDEEGWLRPGEASNVHVEPFPGARIDPRALEVNGIDPDQPLRGALPEREALARIFQPVRQAVRRYQCQRAILVGHNASFDLAFLNAAVRRTEFKRNPFHPFSCFDTVSLAGLAYGQTVLGRALQAAGFRWDESEAHSALYDAEQTAKLFCAIVNRWEALSRLEREGLLKPAAAAS
jgi:ribonuclease T